jgi:glucosamine kinase
MSFYLAIDAGGTKTDYVLADGVRELARVRTGTIKRLRADADTTTYNLETALAELHSASGVPMSAIERTCVGTAGDSVPLVSDWLRNAIPARVGGELLLMGDVEIALDAAFFGGPGVLILAGTGSNVAGRTSIGRLTSAGGWGPALADQGSGHSIGHNALRACFMAVDEEKPTTLLQAILDFWKIASLDLLVEYANSTPAPDFSRLTQVTAACAAQGDQVARSVLVTEGEQLAHLAHLVIQRLLHESPNLVPRVAFAGSIMEKVTLVRDTVARKIKDRFPQAQILDGVVDPIMGALWRARNQRIAHPPRQFRHPILDEVRASEAS